MTTTQIWFRNPDAYIRELVECGSTLIAWDRGVLVKKRIDPAKHAALYYGKTFKYRVLCVGDQGTAELRPGDTLDKPTAVYPTWSYGEEWALLEDMLENPAGQNKEACTDPRVRNDERPIFGQEHRVVITNLPSGQTLHGRAFIRRLKELQEDYPDAIIHIHGLYAIRLTCGLGFKSADLEPRSSAQKGKVMLANGKEVLYERAQSNPKWITPLGFKPVDLEIPRNRCMYNIKACEWAGKYYADTFNFMVKNGGGEVDATTPEAEYKPRETKAVMTKNLPVLRGDKFQCDTCSLQTTCKSFRSGAVCSLPDAEPTELAKFFKTRDAETIMDGLGTLMAANTRRLERGMRAESMMDELDPEVSKIMGQVFEQGVKLAKLVDPALRGGTKVQVNVGNGGTSSVQVGNPRQLVAAAVRELRQRGFTEDQITPDVIQGVLTGMGNQEQARHSIEGAIAGQVIEDGN